jgi:hypothetical protein
VADGLEREGRNALLRVRARPSRFLDCSDAPASPTHRSSLLAQEAGNGRASRRLESEPAPGRLLGLTAPDLHGAPSASASLYTIRIVRSLLLCSKPSSQPAPRSVGQLSATLAGYRASTLCRGPAWPSKARQGLRQAACYGSGKSSRSEQWALQTTRGQR